jgi:sirohydrochlorin ferrochelatase
MRALLLVAHGSRRAASNEEVRRLAQRIADRAGARYGVVRAAFLELAQPSIPEGLERCIQDGADQVIVLPYFLSAGRHVAEDIPTEVGVKQAEHPGVSIHVAPYLGRSEALADILLHMAGSA